MRRKIMAFVMMFLLIAGLGYAGKQVKVKERTFDIYTDKVSPSNHFIPSGWMGDFNDLVYDDQCMDNPHSGATSIKITYKAKRSNGAGWAGIYWQSSLNNWGTQDTGFDLTGFNKLVFWARGEKGGEVITEAKVGGIIYKKGSSEPLKYPDSLEAKIGPIRLTKEWKQYYINLVDKDLSYVNGGFAIVFDANQTGGEQTIYLDEIRFVYDPTLTKEEKKISFPFYVYADNGSLDNHYIPSGWMGDFGGLKFDQASKVSPFSGDTCIRVEYKGSLWTGIFWQNPANNWGKIPNAGIDLSGATKLTFWARGEKGGEIIDKFQVGGINGGPYMDSDEAVIGPVKLSKEWTKYEIDLRGKDLSYIIGGFMFVVSGPSNPDGVVFYIDEVKYESE